MSLLFIKRLLATLPNFEYIIWINTCFLFIFSVLLKYSIDYTCDTFYVCVLCLFISLYFCVYVLLSVSMSGFQVSIYLFFIFVSVIQSFCLLLGTYKYIHLHVFIKYVKQLMFILSHSGYHLHFIVPKTMQSVMYMAFWFVWIVARMGLSSLLWIYNIQ